MRPELLVEPTGSRLLCTDTAEIRTGFTVGLTGTLHQFVIADLDITANRNLSQAAWIEVWPASGKQTPNTQRPTSNVHLAQFPVRRSVFDVGRSAFASAELYPGSCSRQRFDELPSSRLYS